MSPRGTLLLPGDSFWGAESQLYSGARGSAATLPSPACLPKPTQTPTQSKTSSVFHPKILLFSVADHCPCQPSFPWAPPLPTSGDPRRGAEAPSVPKVSSETASEWFRQQSLPHLCFGSDSLCCIRGGSVDTGLFVNKSLILTHIYA